MAVIISSANYGASGAYVGPADIATSPLGWWGLRAMSAAYAGGAAAFDLAATGDDRATRH